MSHGHPRTVLDGWHHAEPSSADPPELRMPGTLVPTPSWVCLQVVSCEPDLGLAAKAARDYSERILREWGLPVLADDAAVIVSELVSNAIRHGVSGRNGPVHDRIELILWRQSGQVICAVTDPGTGAPAVADGDPLAEDGRGLHVVEALSDAWGWARLGGSRKAVWAALPVPGTEPGRADNGRGHAAWEWSSLPA